MSASKEQFIIFTDLDGTLLDHYDYSWQAAASTIEALKAANVPIILNTSKTLAELETIQSELALDAPFIIENGAAVYLPKKVIKEQPSDTISVGGFWVKEFSSKVSFWLKLIEQVGVNYADMFCSFSQMAAAELAELTGLTLSQATQAKQRQYGEPVHWFGDDEQKAAFIETLVDAGASVVQGGRFIHVSGDCDKGQALIWLAELYREQLSAQKSEKPLLTIALGDGENDIAMLDAADIAVQVRSPVHKFPRLYRQFGVTQTEKFGPAGWAEALTQLVLNQNKSTAQLSSPVRAEAKQSKDSNSISSHPSINEVTHG